MVDIWKRVFPSLYQTPNFSKIDPEKEGILDFCPICQEQLPDKKIITYKRHEWEKHKKSDKQVSKDIKTNLRFVVLLLGVMGFMMVVMIDGLVLTGVSMYEEGRWTEADECELLGLEISTAIYEDGGVLTDTQNKFNTLMTECNASFRVHTYQGDYTSITIAMMESLNGKSLLMDEPMVTDTDKYEERKEALEKLLEQKEQLN